jgi:hypothetical protein
MAKEMYSSSSRNENSLYTLTRKFISLFSPKNQNTVDLNTAAYHLNVSKRRIYDITNVLEGLSLIRKIQVNYVKWIGSKIEDYDDYEEDVNDEREAIDLEKELEGLY